MTSYEHDSSKLAKDYDRLSDTQFESGKGLAERMGLQAGARVLDVGRGQPAPPPPSHSRPLAETSPMWRQRHSPERHSPIRSTPAGSRRTPHCRPEVGGLHPRYIRQAA